MTSIIKFSDKYFIDIPDTANKIVVCLDKTNTGAIDECKFLVINQHNKRVAKFAEYNHAVDYAEYLANKQ